MNQTDEELKASKIYFLFLKINIKTLQKEKYKEEDVFLVYRQEKAAVIFKDFITKIDFANFVESKTEPSEILHEFIKSVHEVNALNFIER